MSHFSIFQKKPPAILVVEDEILVRMALSDFLTESGFEVLEADCAAEAINVLQSGRQNVRLVFSDVRMPGEIDGLGLLHWVRTVYDETLPVILTSGDIKNEEAALALDPRAKFLAKPYDVSVVLERIRKELASQER